MQVVPLLIIDRVNARIPNAVPTAQKLDWIGQVEDRIRAEIRRIYGEYVCEVSADAPFFLPCSYDEVERLYRNGVQVPKTDLRSAQTLSPGEYRVIYRTRPCPIEDTVVADGNAVFGADTITFSKPHPFAVGDLIGISQTASNNITATVVSVDNTTVTVDFSGFLTGEMSATVSKISDRELEIPRQHACFGLYEEYLCAQIAKHLCDTERYRLAMTEFERLWALYAAWYKQTAPQDPTAQVRGL